MSVHVQVRGGEIEPFESVKLEIIFTPTIPGETRLDFSFKFSDKNSKPVRNSLFLVLWITKEADTFLVYKAIE